MSVSLTRREFLIDTGCLSLGLMMKSFDLSQNERIMIDHILLGSASLESGIQYVRQKTGVEAVKGGKHPHIGTHNALISLGEKKYLEIISPDPDAPSLVPNYGFLRDLKSPLLITWAARTENMEALLEKVKSAGFQNSGINAGSRQRNDGTVLKWRSLSVETGIGQVMPFFIEWDKSSKHPSVDSPGGCTIRQFEIRHPDSEKVKSVFKQLQIDQETSQGDPASLGLILSTSLGDVSL